MCIYVHKLGDGTYCMINTLLALISEQVQEHDNRRCSDYVCSSLSFSGPEDAYAAVEDVTV